jgi:hypothetical protein
VPFVRSIGARDYSLRSNLQPIPRASDGLSATRIRRMHKPVADVGAGLQKVANGDYRYPSNVEAVCVEASVRFSARGGQ